MEGYPHVDSFIAIDFETAIGKNACQIGIAVVRNGQIVETINRLIRPINNEYDQNTIRVHHITPDMTADKPEFPEVWADIKHYFENSFVVAHNARFDMAVLEYCLHLYQLEMPVIAGSICTCDINNREGLELACARYGIRLEMHHDGENDAINCAKLYLANINGTRQIPEHLIPDSILHPHKTSTWEERFEGHTALRGDVLVKNLEGADPNNPFYNRKVVITGIFDIDRSELALKLQSMGADVDTNVGKKTNYLVIGKDPGLSKLKKFEALLETGFDAYKICEDDLHRILSGEDYEKFHTELPEKSVKSKSK